MPSKISRKAAAFVQGQGLSSLVDILGLEPARGHRPLSQMRAPTVEKRVVNTLNSDCVAYTLAEFQAFFGDAWQDYWENGLRLRSSSVRAFPSVDETDQEDLVPFVGLVVKEDRWQFGTRLMAEVRLLHEGARLTPVTKKSLQTLRSSPRASSRRDVEDKVAILLRLGLPRPLAVAVLHW